MTRLLNLTSLILILLAIAWGAFWIFMGAIHTYPNAEDLGLAAGFKTADFGTRMFDMLMFVDGRYSTNFFHWIGPLVWQGTSSYFILPLISVGLIGLSLYLFISGVTKETAGAIVLLTSGLIATVFFSELSSIDKTLYCWGGTLVYIFPCSFSLLWLGMVLRLFRTAETKYFKRTASFLFISTGFNSMFLPFTAFALLMVLAYAFLYDRKKLPVIGALTLVGISGMLIILLMPGNSQKMANNNPIMERLQDLSFWQILLSQFIKSSAAFFTSLPVWSSVLLVAFYAPIYTRFRNTDNHKLKFVMLSCLIFLACAFPMALIFYLPMYEYGGFPGRVYTPVHLVMFMATMVLLATAGVLISKEYLPTLLLKYAHVPLAAILVIGVTLMPGNYSSMSSEYRGGMYAEFADGMSKRFGAMSAAAVENSHWKNAVIHPLQRYPRTIYNPTEPLPNRQDINWNLAYEEYFGLDDISLTGDTLNRFTYLFK